MEIIKPDFTRFDTIDDFPYQENFVDFDDMQMHYVDEGQGEVILALHGEPSWSYLYRKFIPILKDYRFIAPDLIGFGKYLHFKSLENFIDKLDLNDITLVVQDWGGMLGLSLLAKYPEKFKRVVVLNTFLPIGKKMSLPFRIWVAFTKYHPSLPVGGIIQFASHHKLSKKVIAAYNAPYPNKKHKGGAKAFPSLVPSTPNDPAVPPIKKARAVLAKWDKPALVMFSDKDKVLRGLEKFFYKLIPTSNHQQKIIIKNAGHFLQEEKGEEIASYIDKFIKDQLRITE